MPELNLTPDQEEEAEELGFLCPISMEVMDEPVYAHDNRHAFEKEEIEAHIEDSSEPVCPMCNTPISLDSLSEANDLKSKIQKWIASLNIKKKTEADTRKTLTDMISKINQAKQEAEQTNDTFKVRTFRNMIKLYLDQAKVGDPIQGLPPCPEVITENQIIISEWLSSQVISADERASLAREYNISIKSEEIKIPQAGYDLTKQQERNKGLHQPNAHQEKPSLIVNQASLDTIKSIADDVKNAYKHERYHSGKGFLKRLSKGRKSRKDMLVTLEKSLKDLVDDPGNLEKLRSLKDTLSTLRTQIKAEQGDKKYKLGESGMSALINKIDDATRTLQQPPPSPKVSGRK